MATNRDFGNMINQKSVTDTPQKKPKRESPWVKMKKKKPSQLSYRAKDKPRKESASEMRMLLARRNSDD